MSISAAADPSTIGPRRVAEQRLQPAAADRRGERERQDRGAHRSGSGSQGAKRGDEFIAHVSIAKKHPKGFQVFLYETKVTLDD